MQNRSVQRKQTSATDNFWRHHGTVCRAIVDDLGSTLMTFSVYKVTNVNDCGCHNSIRVTFVWDVVSIPYVQWLSFLCYSRDKWAEQITAVHHGPRPHPNTWILDCIPPFGFSPQLSITFKHPEDSDDNDFATCYPVVNTCSNIIRLPVCASFDEFSRNMMAAINMAVTFSLA